eukprot:622890-Alexandrium_andersonii.AAC.1
MAQRRSARRRANAALQVLNGAVPDALAEDMLACVQTLQRARDELVRWQLRTAALARGRKNVINAGGRVQQELVERA